MDFLKRYKFFVYLITALVVLWSVYTRHEKTVFERNIQLVLELILGLIILRIEFKSIIDFFRKKDRN